MVGPVVGGDGGGGESAFGASVGRGGGESAFGASVGGGGESAAGASVGGSGSDDDRDPSCGIFSLGDRTFQSNNYQ